MGSNRLKQAIRVFQPKNRDWMLYKITRENILTFHHILERCNEGKYEIDNVALLTKDAHHKLNVMQQKNPSLYEEWQQLFRIINKTKERPTDEHIEQMKRLRQKSKEYGYE